MTEKKRIAVIAVGGNALITDPKIPNMEDQWQAVKETAEHIVEMIADGWLVVVTHGNGPQVGFIMLRMELAAKYGDVHEMDLDIIGSDTQGSIGYMLAREIGVELRRRGMDIPVAAIVTQNVVSVDDSAFLKPTKGIGGYLDPNAEGGMQKILQLRSEGWTVEDDAGRGHRRKIASPQPLRIVEMPSIKALVEAGHVVIATGGGGIPVFEKDGRLVGAKAVIDKDLGACMMAIALNADLLIIPTAVEKVCLRFNTPQQTEINSMSYAEASEYLKEGHFHEGSMGPKIRAILRFIAETDGQGIITDPQNIVKAVKGETGTLIH